MHPVMHSLALGELPQREQDPQSWDTGREYVLGDYGSVWEVFVFTSA